MTEPIKVLYFVDRMLRGGIQSLVIDWVSRFDKDKIHVDFLLLDDGNKYELEDTLKEFGCNVYKLKGIWINTPFDFIKESKALDDFFKEYHDYKVVHLHASSKNYLVLKYAKKYRIPIRIAHSHNTAFQTNNVLKVFYGNLLKRKLCKYATDFFACSIKSAYWLFGKKNVNNEKVTIIHNAIDYNKFKYNENYRKEIRNEFKILKDDILFGNVGRFTIQKNHKFLIEIFKEIHKINMNSKLILIGTGEEEDNIKKIVKNLSLQDCVIFAGFRKDVNKIMQAMDAFLLPSLFEGLPVVGVEAQASGLPMFTSKYTVSDEVNISGKVKFIPLSFSSYEWAKIIIQSDLKRQNNEERIKISGYCIEDVIRILQNTYKK